MIYDELLLNKKIYQFRHEKSLRLIKLIDKLIAAITTPEVHIEDNINFLKLNITCRDESRCPFSIWREKSEDEIIFFNIGEKTKEATLLHYWDISSEDTFDEAFGHIQQFLSSKILETKIYCNNRLRMVKYRICDKREYTYLASSFFVCFRKRKEMKQYKAWAL